LSDGGVTVYAVIRTGGKQYRLSPGDKLKIEKIEAETGSTIMFKDVLMVATDDKVTLGSPIVENAAVKGRLLNTAKDRKVLIFKKRRRKGYHRKRGHRQILSEVLIEEIQFGAIKGVAQKAAKKEPAVKSGKETKVKTKSESKPTAKTEKAPAKTKTVKAIKEKK
jgi:large subunit ribosomal protein L21